MPSVRNIKSIRARVWVPPPNTANYRITVERSDGTVDDITDIATSFEIVDGATENIGRFEFEVPNPNETYTSVWTGMEIFRFYCDYAAGTPTTLRFRGRLEKPSKRGNYLLCTGRSESLFVHGQEVHKNYVTQDAGVVIKDLFDSYGESRFDTTKISTSVGTNVSFTFYEIPFWDAVEAVCKAVGYECYIDCNLVVQFFEAGTRVNSTDAIVHDYNLIDVGDFADDITEVKNKIRVIGGTIDGIQVTYTANDTSSQTTNGIRRTTIKDEGIVTYAAAEELAEFILADLKDPSQVGEVTGVMLATIQPGENLWLSAPLDGIQPNNYRIVSYTHRFDDEGLYTSVMVNKEPKKISHVMRDRIQREHRTSGSSSNPDDLDYSEVELFNADVGTRSNTTIADGILRLTTGQSSGTWTSYTFASNTSSIDQIRVDLFGDSVNGVSIEYSINSGTTWTTLTRGVAATVGAGTSVLIRLSLVTGSSVDSMSVRYSLN